ncbi:hypothetical protein CAPTEDRAFT_221773 [Capitella teleta]|uniref:Sulfatase N-terminal domain-containing protein n=1 Tax=Capitella teleta TaxID=283909 RepID=R7TDJ8_CAPTE|nr:hypothetical protein CAPTEDRAFT_221773 [Capitella teleta]|eukprot:ELT89141.1 hypothetical protein CAPTEDRAFT_221773 [Capitella teleta]
MRIQHYLILLCMSVLLFSHDGTCSPKFNVLFLVSDDMRPQLNAYLGEDFPSSTHPRMHTPHLDGLASRSLLLKRAYVQQAVCSPSRTSLLTGRRPDTTRVYDLQHYFRSVGGNFTTIPQYFKSHGYVTAGMGKIFHPGRASNFNDPISWTEPYYSEDNHHWVEEQKNSWFAVNDEETKKFPLPDQLTAQHAIETLTRLAPKAKTGEQPIFVAVGYHKPHLPFVFPSSFLDFYPREDVQLPKNPFAPAYLPEDVWSDFSELRKYKDVADKYGYGAINTTLPNDVVINLRRAYYSAISYTDSLVGKVLQTLDDLELSNNTIVSFWGDHGWQIGEHGEWCKHTNFEIATHAPMMVHVPGLTNTGIVTEHLTEFVDLFPTLAEAAGLPKIPLCPENSANIATCTEGISMVPLMKSNQDIDWKTAAFSQYPKMLIDGDIMMGYSMRTDQYRYTEWLPFDMPAYKPFDDVPVYVVELYDHAVDPDENVNVADFGSYAAVRKILHEKLSQGWRGALPKSG